MPRSHFAEYVPLPEVGEHTDRITIGQLGLPVGFDESLLELNIPGVERTATMAGLGTVSIVGEAGKRDEESFSIGRMGSDGSIVAGGLRIARKAPLYNPRGQRDGSMINAYYRPGVLSINSTGIEERIRNDGKRWKRGPFDPKARAHYMNRGLQDALWHEGIVSHRPHQLHSSYPLSLAVYAFTGDMMTLPDDMGSIVGMLGFVGLLQTLAKAMDLVDRKDAPEALPPRIHSILPGTAIERIPLTGIMAYSTRMIRAVKRPKGVTS